MASAQGRELAGKVALVTGGARNIGRAMALELAAAGASYITGQTIAVNSGQMMF